MLENIFVCTEAKRLSEMYYLGMIEFMRPQVALKETRQMKGVCTSIPSKLVASYKKYAKLDLDKVEGYMLRLKLKDGRTVYTVFVKQKEHNSA